MTAAPSALKTSASTTAAIKAAAPLNARAPSGSLIVLIIVGALIAAFAGDILPFHAGTIKGDIPFRRRALGGGPLPRLAVSRSLFIRKPLRLPVLQSPPLPVFKALDFFVS